MRHEDFWTKSCRREKKRFKEKYKDFVVHKTLWVNRGVISKKKLKKLVNITIKIKWTK